MALLRYDKEPAKDDGVNEIEDIVETRLIGLAETLIAWFSQIGNHVAFKL